jgi:hypothetical protein
MRTKGRIRKVAKIPHLNNEIKSSSLELHVALSCKPKYSLVLLPYSFISFHVLLPPEGFWPVSNENFFVVLARSVLIPCSSLFHSLTTFPDFSCLE